MENTIEVFKVPEENLSTLKHRIEKLNKTARKLQCEPVTLTILGNEQIAVTKVDEFTGRTVVDYYRTVYSVTVAGPAPRINGWEFVAVIQPTVDEDGKTLGNILRHVPGADVEIPLEYRAATNKCDHCQTDRRRLETFILRSDAGQFKQVGRNCLRDFLGHASPEMYAAMAQMLLDAQAFCSDSENDGFGGGRGIRYYTSEEVLTLAACSIRISGWKSRKSAADFGGPCTAGDVGNWLYATAETRKTIKPQLVIEDQDKAVAAEVVEWLASLQTRTDLNDYLYNLSVVGQGATMTEKNFGLACSAIPTYLREKEKELNRRKKFEADKSSVYVGTVGTREVFSNLTLTFAMDLESDFGVTHLLKFRDEAGNVLVWFASTKPFIPTVNEDVMLQNLREQGIPLCYGQGRDIEVGDTVSLLATVIKHNERDGVRQTQVNRGALAVSKDIDKARKAALKAYRKAQAEDAQAATQ